jgi:hypothetical protein
MPTAKKGSKSSGKSSAGNRAAGGMKAKGGKPAGPKKRTTGRAKAGGGRRELIDTGVDKRFVRRRADGTFKESDDVGRSLAADRRRKAKTPAKSGQGDRGDRKR